MPEDSHDAPKAGDLRGLTSNSGSAALPFDTLGCVESTATPEPRRRVVRWTREQIREMFSGLPPPTADDVPITRDGRRLDTPDKVRAFLDELNARRHGSAE